MASNPLRSFIARRAGQCADGSPECGGIRVGDLIVKLDKPYAFDAPYSVQRLTGDMYYYLRYAHLKCHQETEMARKEKAS